MAEQIQNIRETDPFTPNAGPAAALARLDRDSLEKVHCEILVFFSGKCNREPDFQKNSSWRGGGAARESRKGKRPRDRRNEARRREARYVFIRTH